MFKRLFISVLLMMSVMFSFSQMYSINGTVAGLENEEVYLLRIAGDSRKIVDTAQTDMTGSFEMELGHDFPIGHYAIFTGPGKAVELIFNNENIRFVTSGNSADDQVQIIESVENLIYYDYLSIKGINLYKLDVLNPLLQQYPKNDTFYQDALLKARMLQQEVNERVDDLINNNPNALISRYLKVDKPVFADPGLSQTEQKLYLKSNYFNGSDFLDTTLMQSNILTSKVVAYLTLYQDRNFTQEELEDQLIRAVDTVMEKAFVDQQVYEFVFDFLISGFEAIGFERGLEHLATHNLLNELCVNTERKEELENKMELIKKLAIGKVAPDFEANDQLGNTIKLSEIKSEKTLLVFWASWCPHCEDILPGLKKYYDPNDKSKLEIIGISIDEDEEAWKMAVAENGFNWINIAELKGWDGPIIDEYGIAATPFFFVLDKDKKIIGKPNNDREIQEMLK